MNEVVTSITFPNIWYTSVSCMGIEMHHLVAKTLVQTKVGTTTQGRHVAVQRSSGSKVTWSCSQELSHSNTGSAEASGRGSGVVWIGKGCLTITDTCKAALL